MTNSSFTDAECEALVAIISGTIDSLPSFTIPFEEPQPLPDFVLWIGILRKLGEPAKVELQEWLDVAEKEAGVKL